MRPSFLKIFIAALIFFLSGGSGFCESLEGKQIGILIDGPYWHNTPLIDQIKNELKEVSDEDYEIFFPPALQLDGQYNIEKIKTNQLIEEFTPETTASKEQMSYDNYILNDIDITDYLPPLDPPFEPLIEITTML